MNKDITLSEVYELTKNEYADETFKKIILAMLEARGYNVLNADLELLVKQRVVITRVDTDQGTKFLKLVEAGCGDDEFEGGKMMAQYFPTIRTEQVIKAGNIDLIIQPLISDVSIDRGMLTDVVGMLEYLQDENGESRFWQVFSDIFNKMRELTANTMEYSVKPAKNDRFFYERLKTMDADGVSGRLEQFYKDEELNIGGTPIRWENLENAQWEIDGAVYNETLQELVTKAKQALNPDTKRIVGLCHGDGHEMNIYTNVLSETPQERKFAYLDMETAGENKVLGEIVIYLVYNSVMADYTVPKYYPEHFSEKNRAMNASIDHMRRKVRPDLSVKYVGDKINIENVGEFGTSPIRKEIARLYASLHANPILELARNKWEDEIDSYIDEALKASFLMRLIAVHNVRKMDSLDQAKIFSLLYKTVGTPKKECETDPVITRFIKAL